MLRYTRHVELCNDIKWEISIWKYLKVFDQIHLKVFGFVSNTFSISLKVFGFVSNTFQSIWPISVLHTTWFHYAFSKLDLQL